jgi:hypothetical protein
LPLLPPFCRCCQSIVIGNGFEVVNA